MKIHDIIIMIVSKNFLKRKKTAIDRTPSKDAFWNLQNLFDTTLGDSALDFDYTPTNRWDETVRDIKIDNLVKGISSTFYSGPDLIGMCEIENEYLAQEIATKLNRNLNRNDYSVAKYIDSPDIVEYIHVLSIPSQFLNSLNPNHII